MNSIRAIFHKHLFHLQVILFVILVLSTSYLILLRFKLPIPYVQLSNLHEIIILSGELLLLTGLYKKYIFKGWYPSQLKYLIRDFLVVNCLFALPFVLFYTDRLQTVMPLFKAIRPYLILGYYSLLAVTIISILSTQKHIQQVNNWLSDKLDLQHELDKEYEVRHREQFMNRYPKFSRLFIIGHLASKISSIGYGYVIGFLSLILLGLILRTWNLDVLTPYADELNHLILAKSISEGYEKISQVTYQRSLYTVTLPAAYFSKVFGFSLWNVRFLGVMVNLLGLLPLYLLSRRINKTIAFLAVGLYVFSPWMIAISRNVREYAYYPFFFYLTALVMVRFYEAVPDKFVIVRDIRSLITLRNVLYLGVAGFLLYFAIAVDVYSTFKVILVMYPIWGILLLRKLDWGSRSSMFIGVILLFIAVILISLILASSQYTAVRKKINEYFLLLFYDSPPQQWYFNRPLVSVIILSLALLSTKYWEKKKFVQPFSVLVYVASLISFSFFYLLSNRPRYAIAAEIWHILIMAVGLFVAYIILDRAFKLKNKWVIWVILLLLFWNIPQSFVPAMHNSPGVHPITTEYHAEVVKVFSFLQNKVQEEDAVVITGFLNSNFQLLGGLKSRNNVIYDYREPGSQELIFEVIDSYPSGWIVLDYPRGYDYSQPVPLEDFEYANKQVAYLGWFEDSYVLRWEGVD